MPSNNTSALVRQLGRLFPGNMGLLIGPGGWREPSHYLPYALDNGAFGAWTKKVKWDAEAFIALLDKAKAARIKPLWVAVPDVVSDAAATKAMWQEWAPLIRVHYRFPLAFVVQDGMVRQDVPTDADIVFVGGSTEWKWASLPAWTAWFRRVHVGRVNTLRRLLHCEERGVESVDGTGWFRGDVQQSRELVQYVTRNVKRQLTLFQPTPELEAVEIPAGECAACGAALSRPAKGGE